MEPDCAQSESPTIDPEELKREYELIEISKELLDQKNEARKLEEIKVKMTEEIATQEKKIQGLSEEVKQAMAQFKQQEEVFRRLDTQVEEMKRKEDYKAKSRLNPTQQKIDPSKYLRKKASRESGEQASMAKKKQGHNIQLENKIFYEL